MDHDNLLTTDLQALIDEEAQRTAGASDRLGSFVPLAQRGIAILNTCVATINRDQFMAAALMLAVQKSATLSFLSYVRGHIAQAEFNMRQTIEFTTLTAYMLAHPEEDVVKYHNGSAGGFVSPKTLSAKAYKWLDKEHAHTSGLLKEIKEQINDSTAHASVFLTHFTFDWESSNDDSDVFRGSFFDSVEDDVVRLHLVSLTRMVVIIVETIRRTSTKYGGCVLKDDIVNELSRLDHMVNAHRDALGARMGLSYKVRS